MNQKLTTKLRILTTPGMPGNLPETPIIGDIPSEFPKMPIVEDLKINYFPGARPEMDFELPGFADIQNRYNN